VPLIVQRDCRSASSAYNDGLDAADADIVIFAHQDVYFPRGWDDKLRDAIRTLDERGEMWGVLGVIGSNADGKLVGGAWSNGLQWKIQSRKFDSPAPVRTFDEIVLVLHKDGGLRFDDNLPGFHLYGTDIALSAIRSGLGAYVFDAPVIHTPIATCSANGGTSCRFRRWSFRLRGRHGRCCGTGCGRRRSGSSDDSSRCRREFDIRPLHSRLGRSAMRVRNSIRSA